MLFVIVLFLVVPIVELYVIIQVAHAIGAGEAIVALLLMSVLGAWLVKLQGLTIWRRFIQTLNERRIPHREIVDGALVLAAGALLLVPGFVSDGLGLLLLLPPIRAGVRNLLLRRFEAGSGLVAFGFSTFRKRPRNQSHLKVDSWEQEEDHPGTDPGELGR